MGYGWFGRAASPPLRDGVAPHRGGLSESAGTRRVDDGAWHHVAVVYDGPTATARYYVDGALDAARVHGVPLGAGVNDADLLIGAGLVHARRAGENGPSARTLRRPRPKPRVLGEAAASVASHRSRHCIRRARALPAGEGPGPTRGPPRRA